MPPAKKGAKSTKFPVARIKKIMQKDEDVGKVAQATPVVISKALELFLQMVVTESAKVTQSRGSKKIEAYHLKHAIETTDMLDFLKDLVENIPDPSAGGTISLDGEDGKSKRGRKKAAPPPTDSDGEPAAPKVKKPRKKRVKKEQQEVQESDHEMAEPSRSAPEENWDEDEE
ncbi:histone-fold-containing protein [Peniophora sp. CONT]|nr:histone-fold-containing protein [Peniophora sp. CONT]